MRPTVEGLEWRDAAKALSQARNPCSQKTFGFMGLSLTSPGSSDHPRVFSAENICAFEDLFTQLTHNKAWL